MYKSKFEEKISNELRIQKIPFKYETIEIRYILEHIYKPDFILPSGILVETKGYFRPEDRQKHIAIRKQFPNLDIRFVFQNANEKISNKSKTTYGEWCTKNNFLWSHKSIPKEWH